MGASTLEIGFISSIYAIVQIISGPIIGTLSDNIGRKQLLQFSFLASSLTPLIIIIINLFQFNYYLLFISIIPMAIFRHSQACIKSILIDQSIKKNNENGTLNAMAKWSSSCYIGTTLGPLIISLLTDNESVNIICTTSLCLFVIAFIVTTIFIHDKNKNFKLKRKQLSLNIFNITFPNKQIKNLIFYHFIAYFALNLYRAG
eukprot:543051_1